MIQESEADGTDPQEQEKEESKTGAEHLATATFEAFLFVFFIALMTVFFVAGGFGIFMGAGCLYLAYACAESATNESVKAYQKLEEKLDKLANR